MIGVKIISLRVNPKTNSPSNSTRELRVRVVVLLSKVCIEQIQMAKVRSWTMVKPFLGEGMAVPNLLKSVGPLT